MVCWRDDPHPYELESVPAFLSTNLDAPVRPPEDVRVAFRANFPRLLARVGEVHLVPGGNAFLRAVIRSALTTLVNATNARGRVFVHDRLAVALESLEGRGHLVIDEVRPLL